jgi:hypothetical protein
MKKLLTSTALMYGDLTAAAFAQLSTPGGASGTIQYSVAVCNPNSPFRCAAPDASGNLPVTLSGSPIVLTYGRATTAAPTYVDGTNNPFSLDLSGNLRTAISGSLPAGTNIIGRVGIDQTTPGTTNGVQVNAALPAGTNTIGSLNPLAGTYTSRNLALTTGGTAQNLMASNASRRKFYIQNPCTATGQGIAAVESIYISFTGAAGVNNGTSIEILACGSYESDAGPISTQAISVNAATTGHKIVAGEM